MDLFRVETGTVPGQSCNEKTMPVLKRNTRKDEPAHTSKAFLIHDSLTCITNLTMTCADPSNNVEGWHIKHTSPVKQRDSKTEAPKSPEYRYLSPKNLEGPLYPSVESNVEVKASDSEKESLLEKNNNVLKHGGSGQLLGSKQLLEDESELKQSRILALAASQPDQPSTSSACLSGNSLADSGKKKTLGELAKEWNTNKNPAKTKAEGKNVKRDVVDNAENDEALVRHSTYYSTSSSIHGMSSQECRLRNKLKTRRHLNRDEVYRERKSSSPPLVKLHAFATE